MRTFAQKQNQPQKAVSSSLARSNMATPGSAHCEHPILHLQRTIGNQAVQWMLQTNAEESKAGLATTASSRFGHDSEIPIQPPAAGAIQTKSAINQPGDEYEQEADHVSQQVMRMPEPQLQHACPCGGECPKCQTKQASREHERLQAKRVATAAVSAQEAAVRQAQLDLQFTELKAPISGRIGDRRVSIGNLVTGGAAGTTLLATIASVDPIRFEFTMDEASYLRTMRLAGDSNSATGRGTNLSVRLKLIDEAKRGLGLDSLV